MTYSTKTDKKVEWEKARRAAYNVHKKHNIVDFPIDLISLMDQYPDLKVVTYSEFATKRNIPLNEVQSITLSTDGCIVYKQKNNKHMVIYNENIKPAERIYWTLAHEFGHYCLGHLRESERGSLARGELTDEEYLRYETEADFFARFLINPPSLIQEFRPIDSNRVSQLFQVSYKAANNTIGYLNKISRDGWMVTLPKDMKSHFQQLIDKVKHGHKCPNCRSSFILKGATYCIFCSSSNIQSYYKGVDEMIYSGVSTNDYGKAHTCPRCENEEVFDHGDHCIACGVLLINRCTRSETDINGYVIDECDQLLPGNARYCFTCGHESTFFVNNLLERWERVLERQQQMMDVPF